MCSKRNSAGSSTALAKETEAANVNPGIVDTDPDAEATNKSTDTETTKTPDSEIQNQGQAEEQPICSEDANDQSEAVADHAELALATDAEGDEADEDDERAADTKKKVNRPPSNKKLTLELMKETRGRFALEGIVFSQANIIKVLGGSYSTVGALMRQLEALEKEPFNLEVVVSEATKEAIRADVNRHLEVYRDSITDKLDKIEGTKQALAEAADTITKLQDMIAKLMDR